MNLFEQLLEFDKNLLLCLNSYHSPLWDNFFWIITTTAVWLPLYFTLAYIFIKNYSVRGVWFVVFIAILIVLCDQISSSIFKVFFERLRPSREPFLRDIVHIVGNKRGGMYSFVSSHATNSFGLAMFLSLIFRNRWFNVVIFFWATLFSYSRIYLGLHYPGDILGGAILGISIAGMVYALYINLLPRFVFISHHNRQTLKKGLAQSISVSSINLLSYAVVITFVLVFISAKVIL